VVGIAGLEPATKRL